MFIIQTKPTGIAIHRLNIVSGNRLLVCDEGNNSRILIVKFTPPSISSLGSFGTGLGQFRNPKGIAVHYSTGTIFVCDTGNDRIQKYTRGNPIPTSWGSPGSEDEQFNQPWAIAVDPSTSEVYVSDKGNNRILKFTSEGKLILKFVGIWSTGMAVDLSGNVFVSVSYKNKIYKLSSNLEKLEVWGNYGTADGEFDNPHGMAVDNKNDVYVVDTGNFRVQKFSNSWQHLKTWGNVTGDGKFRIPYGIAFDGSTNSVNVTDNSQGNVQTFTQNGIFLQRISLQ